MCPNDRVELYKNIREKRFDNRNQLAKALRITLTQLKHYETLPISTREILLVKLQKISGMSVTDFWKMLEIEATKVDRARRKAAQAEESGDL